MCLSTRFTPALVEDEPGEKKGLLDQPLERLRPRRVFAVIFPNVSGGASLLGWNAGIFSPSKDALEFSIDEWRK